jgi:mannan endo-1,4-beta-mannosidase
MMPAAALAAVLSVLASLAQFHIFGPNGNGVMVLPNQLTATRASYLGVYTPGEPAYQSAASFAAAAGKHPNLVETVVNWAEPFATAFASVLYKHGEILLVELEPTHASMAAISAGDYDGYLRSYADTVRDFGHQVVIGFGREMNGPRYSWGYSHTPPSMFVAAWQHIVRVFRSQGTDNVTWLWTIEANHPGTGPIANWWPGVNYVTWVGIDGSYRRPSDTFSSVFGKTIDEVRRFTDKPVLLSSAAVARNADQYASIASLFSGVARYQLLGLVWFDAGASRLEGNPLAEAAFRMGTTRMTLIATRP